MRWPANQDFEDTIVLGKPSYRPTGAIVLEINDRSISRNDDAYFANDLRGLWVPA
jgi:hypothetical protein